MTSRNSTPGVSGTFTATSIRIAGPSIQSSSGKGSTGLPSVAITHASASITEIAMIRLMSRFITRSRAQPPVGTASTGSSSPFTVWTSPKVPALAAPALVLKGRNLPVGSMLQSRQATTMSAAKPGGSASSTISTPNRPRPSCSMLLQCGWKKKLPASGGVKA